MKLCIPDLAPGLNGSNGLMRMHYQAYRKLRRDWTMQVRAAAGTRKAPVPCRVRIERHICRQKMDADNLYATAKVPLDALRHAGVLPDDDPDSVAALEVVQVRAPSRKEERTCLVITAIE